MADNVSNTQTYLEGLTTARNTIRNKMVNLGLGESSDKLADLATEIDGIANRGTPSANVKEGESYTIQPGYYAGGTVNGVAGGGNYTLQTKSTTPTKAQQTVTSDEGYYGLSSVTVEAIPEAYQDVSSVTAEAGDVLTGKIFVDSTGENVAGTMVNQGAVSAKVSVATPSYTVPKGFHSGTGTVSITTETKTATPSTASQDITPTEGKVLSKVTVNAIPAKFADTTDADAVAANIEDGKTAYIYDEAEAKAVKVTGSMPVITAANTVLDATTGNQSKTIEAGKHSGTATVSIVLEEKTATPTKSAQNVTPTAGKVLSKVTVAAIPNNFIDTTDADAVAANILADKTAYVNGLKVTGVMTDHSGMDNQTINGTTVTSYTIPAGYHSGNVTVSLDDTIERMLAEI